MFEQIYDSIMSSNSEQQEKQAIVLRGELENHLLSIVDLKISEESESERIRRLEWENKIDNRFEGFKKTLSSELLLLEKRIDAIEKRRNKNLNPADDDVTIMDKTSRKRSAEEMEEDDSDIEEEDFSSSTTSNTNATGNNTRKGKRKFNTPPELVNLTKRVEILEAHASSSSSASSSLLSPSSSSMISPRHADTSIIATSTQSETAYTTTFRPISSLRGT